MFQKQIGLLTIGLATVPETVLAAPDGSVPHTFRAIEFGYEGQDRMIMVTAMLRSTFAIESSLSESKVALAKAGARCRRETPSRLRCEANSFESDDDVLHDVVWTVDVLRDRDRSIGLKIHRASIGS